MFKPCCCCRWIQCLYHQTGNLNRSLRESILMTRHHPDLGSASDWLKQISHAPWPIEALSSDASSVWNFCARFLDVISRGNLWWRRDMSSVFSGYLKVARYSFSGSTPPKFEHKLRRHNQRFGKIDTTVVLDKDENLLWSSLQGHRSCHSNKITLLPILLAAVYLGTGNCSSKIIHESFFLQ